MFIFSIEKLKIYHIQGFLNQSYRQQLISLQEMIKKLFIFKLAHNLLMIIFTVLLTTENEKKRTITNFAYSALHSTIWLCTHDITRTKMLQSSKVLKECWIFNEGHISNLFYSQKMSMYTIQNRSKFCHVT